MRLIRLALRRPVAVVVAAIAVALMAAFAVTRMRADIFPDLDLPVIYVAQPYGGMSPAQMEGYITYYYEYHFLYINGIESVESKSIQNTSLLKLTFHPGTDMAEALAQTVGYVNRARAFMPPGTVGPFIMRFDAGTVPVGYLVFRSDTRTLGEIQDLALNRVRPQFATLPGLTSPPPFGGSQRSIVIRVDPDRLRSYGMAPDEVIRAVSSGNAIMPSGSVNIGDETRISPINSVVGSIDDLLDLPIRTGAGPPVSVRDVGTVSDSTDIPTAYALVDGRRAVYIPVTKRPNASTLAVVREVKANLPRFQSLVPDDIQVSYELDQSSHVSAALASVLREAGLGALLTGLVVLLFLRDWRSAGIVVVTIPFALVSAVVALWGAGQTINIMTLGGLALAVGILVDEATVAIENIHSHLRRGPSVARAVLDASGEVVVPRLLAMLAVVAVFVPSFFMTGISRSLFVPLSLAVGFAMIASFLLSSSLVPVLSVWWLGAHARPAGETSTAEEWIERLRHRLAAALRRLASVRWLLVAAYIAIAVAIVAAVGPTLGREIFPPGGIKAFQLRFRAPAGTKFESTERLARDVLDAIRATAGPDQVEVTLGYVGVQPSSYPINTIFLWTGGSHEGVLQVALRQERSIDLDALQEKLREVFHQKFADAQFSFEPGDVVSRIMNVGAPTPVEVAVMGPDFGVSRAFAARVRTELGRVGALRDLQYGQTLDYPAIQVDVDRRLAGQLGVTVDQVGRSFAAATSSSRFVAPNYWEDPRSGIAFQVQVQVPQPRMTTLEDLRVVPVTAGGLARPLLGDLARIQNATIVGEYDRINGQRMVTLTANVSGEDLGRAAAQVSAAIRRAGDPPRATTVAVRGQIAAMDATFVNITAGLIVAVAVIFLLLAANFQSLRLAFVVVSTVPAVLAGVVVALRVTGTTVNVQSFMGAIMATGVAVANAILLVTFAEQARRQGTSPLDAAIDAARARMRPVLMTSAAMIAGMIPMALAVGAGAEATAPLGRAVIGGLAGATLATLLVLPSIYSLVQRSAGTNSPSLDPDDPASAFRLAVLLLAAWAAGSCGKATDASRPAAAAQGPPAIDVVRVVEKPLDVQLSLPGELAPFQSVAIFPKVTGFVRTMHVDRGSRVRAGDLLVTLDAPELVAERSEAESKLRAAEAQLSAAEAKAQADRQTFERLKAASAVPGVVAGNDVAIAEKAADASRNQVLAAQQSVEAARQAVNVVRDREAYLCVSAPFAGVVTERNAHPGALVGPSSGAAAPPMLRLVENDRLRLVVAVPEAYTSAVTIGTSIPFSVAAYPAQTFSGTAARVARSVDVATRTMAVELDVANGNGQLAPGEFCQVRWPVRRSGPSLFVPSGSVAATTDRTFVIRIRDGKAEWVDVRIGLSSGTLVEVFGDLHAGDEVAGRGTDELQPGTEVRARDNKPQA